ncbi:MAG: hypothetical protein E7107_14990 [Prevotella sp.]|nr:hypothetical protein [Prevotella sp.]
MKNLVLIFALLMTLACCTSEADRERMRALLDRADSMNRAYVPMTDGIDSLLLEATRYYDRHGDANQQLRAHYLLGCAYRDMGEAPAALQSYQDAIDRADTLSSDCDYRRLMSVYGQMSELFHAQNLPHDELAQMEMYGYYALLIGDTLLYIRNFELYAKPYFLMGDTMGMLNVLKQAHDLYTIHGFTQEAARVLSPVIDYYIAKDRLDEAADLMNVYEKQSGLFDSEGKIAASREMYYYIKGCYYLKRHDLSLAEQWFRKLPSTEQKDAYKGLLSVFRMKNQLDSVAKYAYLYENALDTLHNKMQTEAIQQMSSLYNYQHFQREKAQEAEKARRLRLTIYAILVAVLAGAIAGLYLLRRHKMIEKAKIDKLLDAYSKGKVEYQRLCTDYATIQEEKEGLLKVCQEIDGLKQDNNTLHESLVYLKTEKESQLNKKEDEIAGLKKQLAKKEWELREKHIYDQFAVFSSSSIVAKLREKCGPQSVKHSKLSEKERYVLIQQFLTDMPLFASVLSSRAVLTHGEKCICILLLLGFQQDEIMRLMDMTTQSVTNFKAKANKKLFNTDSANTLQANLQSALTL